MNDRKKQNVLMVAIQGYLGAFHEVAARQYFGAQSLEIVPAHTFEALVAVLEEGKSDTALMAIENTIAGSIIRNYDLLHNSNLTIVGEVFLRIEQNLMVLPGQSISDLEAVHSHPMAIAQCREFFKQYPNIRLVESADTALSAKDIRQNNRSTIGAIASTQAAALYDLDIIAPSIETNKRNATRFLVLEQQKEQATTVVDADKVSLSFVIEHKVGSLHQVLAALAENQANLTKIQSVPIIGKEWEYRFFIDFVCTKNYRKAINAIQALTSELQVLGSYRQGVNCALSEATV